MALSRRSFLGAGTAGLSALAAGCRRQVLGASPVPAGVAPRPGVFQDVCPRWSNDGEQIAFLRLTADRKYQLFTAEADLSDPQPRVEPVWINPDRPLRAGRAGHLAPDGIAWSPDDSQIAFPRVEWFRYDDGERLPGTALWSLDVQRQSVRPL